MSREINDLAFQALNEVLIINGVQPIPENHYLRQHLAYWLTADAKASEPKKSAGRPKLRDAAAPDSKASYWKSVVASEFIGAARCAWQVLGLDENGDLWCRVIDAPQNFIGKPVKFDRRMKPKNLIDPNHVKYFVKLLNDKGDYAYDLRGEYGVSTEGLF